SLVMSGTLTSFFVAVMGVVIGVGAGVPLGLAAASRGGAVEWLVLRFSDLAFAFPSVVIAILITTLVGPGELNAIVAIGIFNIPVFARWRAAGRWPSPHRIMSPPPGWRASGPAPSRCGTCCPIS